MNSSAPRKRQASKGFTIMEVALAATVLALTMVGMIGVIESGTQMLDLSRKQTLAGQILHSEIDQLRLQSWMEIAGEPASALATSFYSATQVGYSGTAGMLTTPGNGYEASTVLTIANDPSYATFVTQFQTQNPSYQSLNKIFTLTRTVGCVKPTQANPNPTAYTATPLLLQVTFTITWKGMTGQTYTRISTTYVGYNGIYQAYQRS